MVDLEPVELEPGLAHPSKRALRWNAALTIVLLALIALFANLLADRHLRIRADLSEDGLNSMSDATKSIVARIEDRVTVRLFVTEDVEDGQLALRGARIRGQLEEILQLRPEAFELQTLDPTRSSEARRNADDSGFRPMRAQAAALEGGGSGEPVWLSLELAYRGRTERIPAPRPFEFETQFASALHGLLADRKPGIGWIGAAIEPSPTQDQNKARIAEASPTYRYLRSTLERRSHFTVLEGLETGRAVPDDIDVVFVVRPSGLPERTVYEIDQFVQRGGRLIVCIDDPDYNVLVGNATYSEEDLKTSAFGKLLRGWGIEVLTSKHIWDGKWKSTRAAWTGQAIVAVHSPLLITVPDEGLSDDLSPTRGVERVQFAWAHPIVPAELRPVPDGIKREDLAWSSDDSRLDEILLQLGTDSRELRNRMTYLRQKPSARHVIGAVFGGLFPSPWKEAAPPPVIGRDGRPSSSEGPVSTSVGPRSTSQVVVFGDADWLRDPWAPQGEVLAPFSASGGVVLAENLIDWLTLDEELIGLRSRAPKPRPLRDFLTEEMQKAGVFERDPFETAYEQGMRDQKSDRARQLARGKQWLTMLLPAGGALLVLGLFGAAWNLTQRSRKTRAAGEKR
ncbi:ABC-type uncharacterized transport system [Planctomycetes bacterium Poly30]|uniref:ABC-type uncharacterized transport system n=1 Tax=Saltatorellus ferox TaxID=2528018 RepID=A0A518ERY8_9BACT|nr:ABC-type uncharacterized transport system [Planctomycetes bacterium Poly30]